MVQLKKEERLCKIVWNSKGWQTPTERAWNSDYRSNPKKPYERQCGFVHEDWLFNTQFLIEGHQYGYIEGFNKLKKSVSIVDTVHLFTINPNTKERFYIGKLFNAERLDPNNYSKKVKDTLKKYLPEMKKQLEVVGADVKELDRLPFNFNVRVRKENIILFQDFSIIRDDDFKKKYTRTSPIEMNEDLRKILSETKSDTSSFKFIPSSPDDKKKHYVKASKDGQILVSKVHQDIEEHLYRYLLANGISKKNIACDTASFGGKLADVLVKHDKDSYSIYEIKTNIDLRTALREAVGQLLDYAGWEEYIKIKELIAVVPDTQTGEEINNYIRRMKQSLNYKLSILLYNNSNNTFRML